jgi:uncharacterized circularly permuted ATP-grasp superfamily protein/uncharacterized alpha-E superfamily protein
MTAPAALPAPTPGELRHRADALARLVEDDGIVVGTDAEGQPRHLAVDPLPLVIGAPEWAALERGLAQRARLLDLLLADLYGPRTLVARGLLPPEIVVGHPGFLAPAAGIPTRHGLVVTAADLGRDGDGRWRVLADRTQRPLGAGYAMAIRRVTARALAPQHRVTPLRRLRGYFDTLRSGLLELAAPATEAPRVVMLRSPELEASAFDEMFAATLLGFPVVVADDLALRGGRVWLTTTERDEPVDVLVRRVDAVRSDPLDLAPGSDAGLPGLVEATRRGQVRVVNPVGAGVLENPALAAFLPAVARALLDEDLLLPSARTWWCGDEQGRRHAEAGLADLVLAPLAPDYGHGRVFTAELTREERAGLWARVAAEPWAWAAQEVLPPWCADVVAEGGTDPRVGLLRAFTVAGADGATVMPGGLARFAPSGAARRVPTLADSVAKDVWVLDADAARAAELPPGTGEGVRDRLVLVGGGVSAPVPLPPRAADDLYWFGRYVERAESTARLLLVADDLVEDHLGRPGTPGHAAMAVVLDAIDAVTAGQRYRGRPDGSLPPAPLGGGDPVQHLRDLLFDAERRGGVRYSARRAGRAASQVRELLSFDTWLLLSRLQRTLTPSAAAEDDLPGIAAGVVESCLALSGMSAEGLVRDASWAFHDAGRRVERAQETVRVLRRTLPGAARSGHDLVLEATLRARESLLSYRRRRAEGGPAREPLAVALELLLLDDTNPRSVAHQLGRLQDDLRHAPSPEAVAALRSPTLRLAGADAAALARDAAALGVFLADLEGELRAVSTTLEATCFPHRAPQRTFEERQ